MSEQEESFLPIDDTHRVHVIVGGYSGKRYYFPQRVNKQGMWETYEQGHSARYRRSFRTAYNVIARTLGWESRNATDQ